MEQRRLKSIYRAARGLRFSPSPWVSTKDLLALAGVMAGKKPGAAFGFLSDDNEGEIRELREELVNLGLETVITRSIRRPVSRHLDGFAPDVIAAFDSHELEADRRRRDFLLWVSIGAQLRQQIKAAVNAPASVGQLLGYPSCCVRREEDSHREMDRTFGTAVIEAAGPDAKSVLAVLRNDVKVTVETSGHANLWKTDEAYPFVFHTACDSCLTSPENPTGKLNAQFQTLAADLDPALQRTILEMSQLEVEIGRICSESDENGLSPETIDSETRQRLDNLSETCESLLEAFWDSP
jgi:hypothetical protein